MSTLGSVLQVAGMGLAVVGFWHVAVFLGLLAAGCSVFAVGFQLERLGNA